MERPEDEVGSWSGTPGANRGFHEISESQNWCWCQGISLCLFSSILGQGWWQRWLLQPEEGWRGGCSDRDPVGCVSLSSCFCLWRSPDSWSVQFLLCKSSNSFWFLWNKKRAKLASLWKSPPEVGYVLSHLFPLYCSVKTHSFILIWAHLSPSLHLANPLRARLEPESSMPVPHPAYLCLASVGASPTSL